MQTTDTEAPTVEPVPEHLLIPAAPSWTEWDRYNGIKEKCTPTSFLIRPGQFSYAGESEPPYMPQGWSSHVQPEGQIYFACESKPRIVTDAYMHVPAVQERILRFVDILNKTIEAKGIVLPNSVECALKPDDVLDVCYYYFVDHASHTLFWLKEVSSEAVSLPHCVSESHLRLEMEHQYWIHIQLFPSHCSSSLFLAIDELISAYVQGENDRHTSETSAFPYTAEFCQHTIRLLQIARETADRPNSIWVIARAWAGIARHRHEIYYGQERARLDRMQTIRALPERRGSRLFSVTSRLLFGVPAYYAGRIDLMWRDERVNVSMWQEFVGKTKIEWGQQLTSSLGLSILNAIFLLISGTSSVLSILALLLCALAAAASFALNARHPDPTPYSGDEAGQFLNESAADAHQSTAIAFSVPRVTVMWAAVVSASQALYALEQQPQFRAAIECMTTVYAPAALTRANDAMNICVPWARAHPMVVGGGLAASLVVVLSGLVTRRILRRRAAEKPADVENVTIVIAMKA